jgi:hypothetical protein
VMSAPAWSSLPIAALVRGSWLGFEFRVSGFGFRDWVFGFQDSGFGLRVFGMRVSGFGVRDSPPVGVHPRNKSRGPLEEGHEGHRQNRRADLLAHKIFFAFITR